MPSGSTRTDANTNPTVRHFVLLILAVLLVAGVGYALGGPSGAWSQPAVVVMAATSALVAGGAAGVPLLLSRGTTQPAAAQAALVGTVIHLFGCLIGAGVLFLGLHAGLGAVYWMLAFYWATLVVLVIEFSRAVRAAPPAAPLAPKQ